MSLTVIDTRRPIGPDCCQGCHYKAPTNELCPTHAELDAMHLKCQFEAVADGDKIRLREYTTNHVWVSK